MRRCASASLLVCLKSSALGCQKLGKQDVASAILYLASDEAHHVTGVIFNVDGMAQLS